MANDFKSLFMLDPEVTYFNHGAYGGCPEDIFNAMLEWQKTLEKNPSKYMKSYMIIWKIREIHYQSILIVIKTILYFLTTLPQL